MTITPSHIIQYLYCPRFTYFEYVLRIPQYEERHFKVRQGRTLHERKTVENKAYLRKRLGIKAKYIDQYLTNDLLRGTVDEILELPDGSMAPLDYKFAEYKEIVYEGYRTQLYCYAWLIREHFDCEVDRGYLIYSRSNDRLVEVPITPNDIEGVKIHIYAILKIINGNIYPLATKNKQKCVNCTYRNICTK